MMTDEWRSEALSGAKSFGEELLAVSGLSSKDGIVRDVSFTLRKGEILGIFGLGESAMGYGMQMLLVAAGNVWLGTWAVYRFLAWPTRVWQKQLGARSPATLIGAGHYSPMLGRILALLFALFRSKPSPFCILDEVDGPLDESNISRFMQLVRDFTDETQFIIITHSQLTMGMMDSIWGVTQQERGISKVIGLQYAKMEEMSGDGAQPRPAAAPEEEREALAGA
jgi:hypothetical protein